ncbi:spore maturation protein A [Desulfonispora thiosulfatigenes DSM 11270]|uniref:Spore maturation protein A n=1 Tax=Desulfonispora thiosulfatigenes DSM 11270 TaxID=656914 RepID=A0A1W1VLV9_DESTI|nr:nucleoside recognition domain-containing protein [Desulfonispora thiosulfatigenes]SMB94369.1 spore maturation protein A [Desulfonispora thiosulfatigenes DSM 11270]
MINIIWLGLIVIGTLVACFNGQPEIITDSALKAANLGVKYSFDLIGLMTFWLGIMKLGEKSGLIDNLAKILRPITKILFPSIPKDHPAMGSILLNISANILGLGNAATPFGLKAMQELQSLNNNSDRASDAMITFLAVNTSCIVIIPATIIGVRLAAGSANPTEIVGTTIIATSVGMTVSLTMDKILRYFTRKD